MAQISMRVCDRCKRRSDEVNVTPWSARRGPARVGGDLCDSCWADVLTTFQPEPVTRTRHKIVVTEPARPSRKRK